MARPAETMKTPTLETGTTRSSQATSRASRARRSSGFTLLELLATVAVMGLILGLVLPNLGLTRRGALTNAATQLATTLELARQRSVMTGRAHRVLIGVEDGSYQLEWFVGENEALGLVQADAEAAPLDLTGASPIPMAAPRDRTLSYRPVPTRFGTREWLDDDLRFDGVEIAEGWLDSGDVGVVFQDDGSTDFAQIFISGPSERRISLEVLPFREVVRIRHEEP
jgi:type II secretion system protein H